MILERIVKLFIPSRSTDFSHHCSGANLFYMVQSNSFLTDHKMTLLLVRAFTTCRYSRVWWVTFFKTEEHQAVVRH